MDVAVAEEDPTTSNDERGDVRTAKSGELQRVVAIVSPAVAITTSLTAAHKRHQTRETTVGYPPGTESSRVKTNVPFL